MEILKGYIYSYVFLFGVIFSIGAAQKIFRFKLEISRKLIHMFIGFTWLILYKYHANTLHFIVVPFSFIIINYLSFKYKIFKMYERTDETKNHYGTIYYAVAMTVMSVISLIFPTFLIPYGISVFCLSFGDGAAALFGPSFHRYNFMITKEKSFAGTLFCAVFAFLGILLFNQIIHTNLSLWEIMLLSISTAVLELVGKGLDNFTIIGGIALLSSIMLG